jgi:hypothetical protein
MEKECGLSLSLRVIVLSLQLEVAEFQVSLSGKLTNFPPVST